MQKRFIFVNCTFQDFCFLFLTSSLCLGSFKCWCFRSFVSTAQSCCVMKTFRNLRHRLKSIRYTLRHSLSSTIWWLFSPKPNSHVNSLIAKSPFSIFFSVSKNWLTKSSFNVRSRSNSSSIWFKSVETELKLSLLMVRNCKINILVDLAAAKTRLNIRVIFTAESVEIFFIFHGSST